MTSIDPGSDAGWAPDACTLPTVQRPLRLAELDALFSTVTAVDRRSATHATLTLAGEPGLAARARDLADRETACCSFFSFEVSADGSEPERVRMGISVPEAQAAVLDALVRRAEQAIR